MSICLEFISQCHYLYKVSMISVLSIYNFWIIGNKLRMVVMAHRRISWQDPSYIGEARSNSVVNKEPFILMATTENYEHEPYVTNDEIKALTQEIIKTIRDIIVSLLKSIRFLNSVHKYLVFLN